jgi:DNA replication protein DnaC
MPEALLTIKTCPFCSAQHESFFSVCPTCTEAREAKRLKADAEALQQQKADQWLDLCPTIYRETDWTRSELHPACAMVAKTWYPSTDGKGLGLRGDSGIGKTRAMWEILKRLHFSGRKVMAIDAIALEQAAADRHHATLGENHAARRLITSAKRCGILFLDDIGKETASPSVAKALHDIIECRTRERLVTLWTTERSGKELGARLGQDYGAGLVRRLREFSTIPEMSPTPKTHYR